ncbi:MAG: DUF1254 domain-containing protein [Solirubrobacteraceae bacterium]
MRRLAAAAAVLAAVLAGAGPAHADDAADRARATALGIEAYEYGIPLLEFLRIRRQQTSVTVPNGRGDAPVNQIGRAALVRPEDRIIPAPSTDTLYTVIHLDLAREPQVLHVPPQGRRYFTFEFIDPYTNVFAYVGTRATGSQGGDFAITGPGWHGRLPRGVRRIRSPFRRAWVGGRTLLRGPSDLAAAQRVQRGYRLVPLSRYGTAWTPPRPRRIVMTPRRAVTPEGLAFFDALGKALAENPPPARDAPLLRRLAAVGIGPGRAPSRDGLPAAVREGLAAAVPAAKAQIQRALFGFIARAPAAANGWVVPKPNTGAFGTDYESRALLAVYGIGANRPVESIYPTAFTDRTGALLSGGSRYVLRFAPGQLPPVRYFWSVTLYDANLFVVPNPIRRFAVGDRTPGLRRRADGSLEIAIQTGRPASGTANWLPAPASGRFVLVMRLYGPSGRVLRGRWPLPTVTKAG